MQLNQQQECALFRQVLLLVLGRASCDSDVARLLREVGVDAQCLPG